MLHINQGEPINLLNHDSISNKFLWLGRKCMLHCYLETSRILINPSTASSPLSFPTGAGGYEEQQRESALCVG